MFCALVGILFWCRWGGLPTTRMIGFWQYIAKMLVTATPSMLRAESNSSERWRSAIYQIPAFLQWLVRQ
jgi:hypothetical protein